MANRKRLITAAVLVLATIMIVVADSHNGNSGNLNLKLWRVSKPLNASFSQHKIRKIEDKRK